MAKKIGRPPFKITETVLKEVEDLASLGLTKQQIADYLGVHVDTVYKYQAQNSEFADAIKRGQSKGVAIMAKRLLEHAKNGSTSAAIFYLKCHGWKETNAVELTGRDGNAIETKTEITELTNAQKKIVDKLLDEDF